MSICTVVGVEMNLRSWSLQFIAIFHSNKKNYGPISLVLGLDFQSWTRDILDKWGGRTYSTLIDVQEISKISSVKFLAERSILSCDGCTILEALAPHIHRLSTISSVHRSSHHFAQSRWMLYCIKREKYLYNEIYVMEILCNQILLSIISLKTGT